MTMPKHKKQSYDAQVAEVQAERERVYFAQKLRDANKIMKHPANIRPPFFMGNTSMSEVNGG